jgi:cell division control protein 7
VSFSAVCLSTDNSHTSGTFSSVYKAIDKNYASHDNRYWEATSVPVPVNAESRKHLEREAEKTNVETRLQRIFGESSKKADGTATGGQVWVALKRIYVTSSPDRIYNELDIMEDLR